MTKHVLPRVIAIFLAAFIVGGFIPNALDSTIDGPNNFSKLLLGIVTLAVFIVVLGVIYLIFGMKFRQGVLEGILGYAVLEVIF